MRRRSIWCSSSSRRTSRASLLSRCSDRRTSRSSMTASPIRRSDVAALNRALSDEGYFGGAENLRAFERSKAARAAVAAADELRALAGKGTPVRAARCAAGVSRRARSHPDVGDPLRERHLRARRAVLSAIHGLRRAHQHLDDSPVELSSVAAMIRRWIEGQTFAPRAGHAGVQLLDAQAARYGEFDEVFLVGLVEGEWPQRSSKSIFYPASLLSQLDWPDSRTALAGERAAFQDLMGLARRQVHLSTFELENDSIVGPSVFLEDADRLGLRTSSSPSPPTRSRMFVHEALASDPVEPSAVEGRGVGVARRCEPRDRKPPADRFHGAAASYKPASLQRQLARAVSPVPVPIFFRAGAEPPGGSGRRSDAQPERARDLRPRGLPEILRGMEPAGASAASRRRICRRRARFSARSSSRCSRRCPKTKRRCSARGFSDRPPTKGSPKRCFSSKPNGRRRSPSGCWSIRSTASSRFAPKPRRGVSRCAEKPIASTCCEDQTFRIIDYKLSRAPDRKLALQLPVYTVCTVQHLRADPRRGLGAGPGRLHRLWPGSPVRADAGARQDQGRDAASTRRRGCSMRSTESSAASFRRRPRTR